MVFAVFQDAAVALSALVHALEEKNMVAIVRYCRCKNANPKLAVLVPEIKFSYEVRIKILYILLILPFVFLFCIYEQYIVSILRAINFES